MKIVGLMASPRIRGNTEILMEQALAGAKEAGAEVEMIRLAEKKIAPCDGCDHCVRTEKCHIEDDMQELYTKLLEIDGLIIGTPVYFWNVSAQAKAFIDRTYALLWPKLKLRNKVCGLIVVEEREGDTSALLALKSFATIHRMIESGTAMAFGDKKGDVRKDEKGMEDAKRAGRAVARRIQMLAQAAKIG